MQDRTQGRARERTRCRQAPGGVILRDMTPADIPAVHELELRLFPVDAWPLQMFAAELAQAQTRRYLVAERAGRIVGYAGLMCIQPIADVQTIAVVPEQEGRGIGSALLTELIRKAGCAMPRTCSWRSGPTIPAPSSSTAATGSNRSTSGPATTATASTR